MKVQIALALVTIIFSASAASAAASFPANTLSCEGFAKRSDGNWAMRPGIRTFDIGDAKGITASNIVIPPGLMVIRGVDIWELLNNKCG